MWVSRLRPLTSPTAYSQPSATPVARMLSSTSTGRPPGRPTVSEAEVVGRGAPCRWPPAARPPRWAGPRPGGRSPCRRARAVRHLRRLRADAHLDAGLGEGLRQQLARERLHLAEQPRRVPAPSSPRRRARAWPAPSRRRPRRRPARPAAGDALAAVTSWLVHGAASARPGIGGTTAVLPVASTTACRAVSSRVEPSRRGHLDPLRAVQPPPAAHELGGHALRSTRPGRESSKCDTASSRRASTARDVDRARAPGRAPGRPRPPGRSGAAGPCSGRTPSRSTRRPPGRPPRSAAVSPPRTARSATFSPAGPRRSRSRRIRPPRLTSKKERATDRTPAQGPVIPALHPRGGCKAIGMR